MGRTLSELRSVQTQIGTMMTALTQMQNTTDELLANKTMARTLVNAQKQVLNIDAEIDRVKLRSDQVKDVVLRLTGRLSFDGVGELLTDLQAHLGLAEDRFGKWRQMKAVVELNSALGNFAKEESQGPTEAQARAQLGVMEREFHAALELADRIAPVVSSSVIEIAR